MDFTGDGRSDLMVTSPWGLGVVGWNGNSFVSSVMCQNGGRIGDWALDTANNAVPISGDFDGDGRAEALLSSPWGIGIASFANGVSSTRAMAANGTRAGGWVVDTTNNRFLHAADVDGDGRAEVLATSPWGIGILALGGGGLTSRMLAPNGTRFGGWLLNTADNWFPAVGDMTGDGRSELVVTSPWGLGILRFDGTSLNTVTLLPNGTMIGSWRLDTSTDRIETVADLDGDGRAELVVSGPAGLAVLALDADALTMKAVVAAGTAAGSWTVDAAYNSFSAGDVDGDGRAELVVTSDWGIGVLELVSGNLQSQLVAANGTHLGDWNLNTRDNRLVLCADIDGDGHDEVVVTSPWGLGVLRLGGSTGSALMLSPNGTHFGGWNLNTADNDWTAGHRQAWGVILHHPDWGGAVDDTTQALRSRGYTILDTDSAATGTTLLAQLAHAARSTDRVFVYLAGHGATDRANGDYTHDVALSHYIEFGAGDGLRLRDITPSFELMAYKGCDVSVFDGSCDAGETVVAATGSRYVAMSTTGARAPGLTNSPSPGGAMKQFGQPSRFGMWWSQADAASLLTGAAPHRFYQKIYRSDDTDVARWSIFYKAAVDFYRGIAGGWDLVTRYCYLFEYVYADVFHDPNAGDEVVNYRNASSKVSLDDYLASMQADLDGFAPSVQKLRGFLADGALVQRAAAVYAPAYPRPWLTTTGELAWNTLLEPVKVVDTDAALSPLNWAGAQGFVALVAECVRMLDILEHSWTEQTVRLHQLDAKLRFGKVFRSVTDVASLQLALTVSEELNRSRFEEERRTERLNLVTALRTSAPLPIPRLSVGHPIALEPFVSPHVPSPNTSGQPPSPLTGLELSTTRIAQKLSDVVRTWVTDASAAEIIAAIRATEVSIGVTLDELHYYLTIVEEALSRAQENGVQPGDMVAF
jgi:hypothetical protein